MTQKFDPRRRAILKAAIAGGAGAAISPFLGSPLSFAQSGGTVTLAIPGVPVTLDPVNQISHDWMVTSQAIFENLIEFDVDGEYKPQLAAAMPALSDDKRTYTFELRDDVVFQNGEPFTAEDVKYSFDWLLDPDNKAMRRPVFARIQEVNILSPTKVEFRLSEPYGPWLAFMTKCMGIFQKGSREANGPDFFRTAPVGVGTGPGIFEEWRPNEYISLVRNDKYYRDGLPAWDRLVVRQINEESTRVAYLMSGQVDLISAPPPKDFDRLSAMPMLEGAKRPTLGGWFAMNIDNTKAPFDDPNVRRAVSCAIDRESIATNVYYDLLSPAALPAPKDAWWYNADADAAASYDIERAQEFMAKSKYADGATFSLMVPSEPYLLDVRDAALVIQSQLAEIGLTMNLEVVEFQVMIQNAIKGTANTMFVNMSPGEPTYHLQNSLTPGQILSKSVKYDGPDMVALLKQGFAEPDQEKQKEIYLKLQDVLLRDMPLIWIGFVYAANIWRKGKPKDFTVNQGLTIVANEIVI
ncbi:ABC transporter substrate-binding protein [Acuticoccus sediminis]|uniref:ABC transporter substrate-binding protein n=1 Tax=Acuticoccus sediminis TaxID=2184697 RepID=UPI001CFDEEA3|nr:ABC transporter substrate-binding protein [Acuticoccus sediminis]